MSDRLHKLLEDIEVLPEIRCRERTQPKAGIGKTLLGIANFGTQRKALEAKQLRSGKRMVK